MGRKMTGKCELCGRTDAELTVHHLVPREMGGTFMATADLCIPCHKQIHALYTNEELASRLSTIEDLQRDAKLSKFIKWIRKQPAARMIQTRKSNERKGKR
ncbi:HNH endonuclease [Bacillus mangrovi]|uniref:HNH endonuclease n=1 Tax=Metabacillus mangrovi TaxID=1491830 RepID=A0A7X2V4P9_9BACI|nr:HNH endonuclease [Metabacillus mangrovi]MTH53324.1 HNH endonuclease [Metabacillus mangrovi]